MTTHDLNIIVINHMEIQYFHKREKNDINGNPRYRVFIIDPDGPAVYETVFKCYESMIPERVKTFIENGGN